ncbi:hypothetical protein EON65_55520 [archaeon]|nr:MAG: hypothetical protein EON65_55520 [archaeon]
MSAQDKASGKSQTITITSDKGRLSEDEIERMVREAEENADVDRAAKELVEAKNQLESYLYSLRNSVQDTLKDKISDEDKQKITSVVSETLSWVETNCAASKEELEVKRKEVEAIANPIISQAYKSSSSPSPPSDANTSSEGSDRSDGQGPNVEEVD